MICYNDRVIDLATSSYASYTPDDGYGFQTTVGKPRHGHRLEHLPAWNQWAPYGVFNRRPAPAQDEFIRLYLQRLEKNRAPLLDGLQDACATHGRVVLLCWCHITTADHTSPNGFCHRRIAAWWVERELGVVVPELTLPGQLATPLF
jgi:hypothetical protein